ncbi:MAG TPA: MBL fold metallo-hydrolase [Candidatus Limnocylindrales bacterium]|nr:MBL fold metallo-hydrolase [Candidatus Limnocylindrales bacterium]
MDPRVEPVVVEVQVPAGMLGPNPISFEVRCFVVADSSGVVLVDSATPNSTDAIGMALDRVGASWPDVSDIVLTHRHIDHTGGLAESVRLASRAKVWAGALDAPEIAFDGRGGVQPLFEGDHVAGLRVFHTPGHTPGHIGLLHEAASILFVGDLIGSRDGALDFGPSAFTADADLSRQSLRRMVDLGPRRIVFSHGEEISDPNTVIRDILDPEGTSPWAGRGSSPSG